MSDTLDKENLEKLQSSLIKLKSRNGVYLGYSSSIYKPRGIAIIANEYYRTDDYNRKLRLIWEIENLTGVKATVWRAELAMLNRSSMSR